MLPSSNQQTDGDILEAVEFPASVVTEISGKLRNAAIAVAAIVLGLGGLVCLRPHRRSRADAAEPAPLREAAA